MNTTNQRPSFIRRGRSVLTATATSAVLVLATLPANAARDTYFVNADVIDVTPITKTRVVEEPRTVCTVDETPRRTRQYANNDWDSPRRGNDAGAAIVGGLIGGILGNQFGGGNGKKALTIGGALAGAAIASEMHRENQRERRRERVRWDDEIYDAQETCWTTTESRTVTSHDGYRVRYRYHGRTFTRTMDRHPGDTVRIRVRVSPA